MTPKQLQFCHEYVVDFNASKAAERVGYSAYTAKVQGARLLSKAMIKAKIHELQLSMQEKSGITAEKVIAELAKIGFSNLQNYISTGNAISDITTLSEEQGAAICSIKTTTIGFGKSAKKEVAIKLHDKVSALEKLGRHLGIFETDNSQKSGTITVEIEE